jgi:hypothetical protein
LYIIADTNFGTYSALVEEQLYTTVCRNVFKHNFHVQVYRIYAAQCENSLLQVLNLHYLGFPFEVRTVRLVQQSLSQVSTPVPFLLSFYMKLCQVISRIYGISSADEKEMTKRMIICVEGIRNCFTRLSKSHFF